MKRFILAALLVSSMAQAGEAALTWTHPTQYTDGTALPIAQIARTEVEYGMCTADKLGMLATPAPKIVTVLPPPAATTITGLGVGSWCFRARTVAVSGTMSVWTGFVNKTLVAPPPLVPNPPGGLTVTPGSLVAYSVVKRVDKFVLAPVGTVPEDTVCNTTQQVNGYYVVPRAAVIWSGSVKPDVVVASCS